MSQRRPTEAEIRDARRLLGVDPGAHRATILEAWRGAVRRHHPDAASEEDRWRAEELCSRINAAKDMLLHLPPEVAATGAARPGPARPGAARPAAARPGPNGVSTQTTAPHPPGYVPTGVRPGQGSPPRTGLLLTFLVAGTLAVLGILAATTHDDEANPNSRIGGSGTTASGAARVDSPSDAMAVLMGAAESHSGVPGGLISPATRLAEVDDMVRRLAGTDPASRAQARSNTKCGPLQPGLSDRAACAVAVPEDLLPRPVALSRVDGSWRVLGYLPPR